MASAGVSHKKRINRPASVSSMARTGSLHQPTAKTVSTSPSTPTLNPDSMGTHNQVVDNDDRRALGDAPLLALERVRAVLELVRDRRALARQLPLLPDRHERASEAGCQDRAEQEPAATGGGASDGGSALAAMSGRGEGGGGGWVAYRASRPTMTSIFLLGVWGMVWVKRWLRKWVVTICGSGKRERQGEQLGRQLGAAPNSPAPSARIRPQKVSPRKRSGPPGSERCQATTRAMTHRSVSSPVPVHPL